MLDNKFKFRLNPDVVDDNEYDEDTYYAEVVGDIVEVTWYTNKSNVVTYHLDVVEYFINEEESWIIVE